MSISRIVIATITLIVTNCINVSAEQIRVWNPTSFEWLGSSQYTCENDCQKTSDKHIADYTENGWKIISSSQKDVVVVNRVKYPGGYSQSLGKYVPECEVVRVCETA